VLAINKEKNEAVGSCRAPSYFSIVKMLEQIGKTGIFERFGGHAQAGGLTIKLDNLDTFRQQIKEYEKKISSDDLEKVVYVDTMIESQDLLSEDIYQLDLLAPF
jgi:single-stranded-DNA-specific exonuclease